MKKTRPGEQPDGEAGTPRRSEGVSYGRKVILVGALRLPDLLEMSHRSPEVLDALRSIHLSARQVIGGNLTSRSLDRLTLERPRASVLRQADQARELQEKLVRVSASDVLRIELAELQEYFDGTLLEIARKLGTKH